MSAMYQTNKTYHDGSLLSITPARRCCGGNYLLSKEEIETCDNMTSTECKSNCCGLGFVGKPVRFEYSTMSDANWSNQIKCDCSHR
jgi:hypothetical protein